MWIAGGLCLCSASSDSLQAQSAWYKRIVPVTSDLASVTFGGGFFSAVANGRPKVLQSRDGRFWTASPLPDVVNQVAFGVGAFYGVGSGSDAALVKSAPGGVFQVSRELDSFISTLDDATKGAIAFDYLSSVSAYVSRDVNRVGFLGYRLPDADTPANVLFLWNGSNWSGREMRLTAGSEDAREFYVDGIILGLNKMLAFSLSSNFSTRGTRLWFKDNSSADLQWSPVEAPSGGWGDIAAGAYGDGNFVLVGKAGRIFRVLESNLNVQRMDSKTAASLSGVAYGNKRWVAVGACGTIVYSLSSGADSWQSAPVRVLDDLSSVTYGWNSFVAVGEGGVILQSN